MSITRGVLLVLEARAREFGVTTDELVLALLDTDNRTTFQKIFERMKAQEGECVITSSISGIMQATRNT